MSRPIENEPKQSEQPRHERVPEREAAQPEAQRLMASLEQRVAARTAELEQANRQLEAEIAEHRRTETALRESEQRFREIAENITEVFWLADRDKTTLLYISPAYETVYQRSCQSMYDNPLSFLELVHPDDLEIVRDSVRRHALGSHQQTYRIIRPDGEIRWIHTRAFPVLDAAGNVLRVAGLTEDVTEARRAEGAIREKNQVLGGILNNLPMVAWRIDKNGLVTLSEGRGLERLGLSNGEMVGRNVFDFSPENTEQFRRALAGETLYYYTEGPPHNPWGFETFLTPDDVHDGGALGFSIDVSEQKAAQDALRQSHQRFNRLVNSQFIGIVIADARGDIVEANDAFLEMLGFDREVLEAGGPRREQFMSAKSRVKYDRNFELLLREGTCAPIELQLLRRDGTRLPVLVGATLLDSFGKRCLCIVLDVSERKRIEKRQRREERLLRRLLDLQEKERKLFAYDVHDGYVQDVVSAKMILEGHQHRLRQLASDHPALLESFQLSIDLLGKAINDGRRLIGELRPMILDEQGVLGAIEYLANDAREKSGVAVTFQHEVQFDRLPDLLENTVFRVVQEALNNVRRHSQCRSAQVTLYQRKGHLVISVTDDGVGFDKGAVPDSRFGLRGIIERARLFGGKARITSQPGQGVQITARFPLDGVGRRKKRGKKFSG